MSNSRKKVIVRRFTGELFPGYLPMSSFTHGPSDGLLVDLLDLSGRIVKLPMQEIKTICYVRDFNLADTVNPERLTRRAFLARPRNEGIWIRLTFRVSDRSPERLPEVLEGLAPGNLAFADSLIDDSGFHLAPPDIRSNTQHIFVPRSAVETLQILAVITNPTRPKPTPARTPEQLRKDLQDSLFDAITPPNNRPN